MKQIRRTKCMKKLISIIVMCAMLAGCAQQVEVNEGITSGTEAEVTVSETTTTESTTVYETTAAETTVVTTKEETTTVEVTEVPMSVPAWTETAVNKTMYVAYDGICSRAEAVQGSEVVKWYGVNDKVNIVAETDTDYYKLDDGSFIHKDYLNINEIVITTEAPVVTTTTTAVVTTTTTPAPEVVPMGSDIEALLNGAKLNPMKTGDENVDRAVDEILAKVTTSGMSTYQKVKAVYDYIINNFTYERVGHEESYTSEVYFRCMLDNIICSQAYSLVKTKHGVCYNYAALFVTLTRRIGLESYYVSGKVSTKSGGKTTHYWVLVKINGKYYTFDSQVEQNNLDNGRIAYRYFGRLESDMVNTYEYDARCGYFEICAMYYVGEDQTFDNARDYVIALFGNFEILEGESPYADWIN